MTTTIDQALANACDNYKQLREEYADDDLMPLLYCVLPTDAVVLIGIGMPGNPLDYLSTIIAAMDDAPEIVVFQVDTFHFIANDDYPFDEKYIGRLQELFKAEHPAVTEAIALTAMDRHGNVRMATHPYDRRHGELEWLDHGIDMNSADPTQITGRVVDAMRRGFGQLARRAN